MRILIILGAIVLAALAITRFASAQSSDYQQASQLFKQGDYAQALDHVDAILKNDPKDVRTRFLKGLIEDQQGKSDDAIATFEALSEDNPELPEPHNNLAVLYAARGDYEKARDELEMAIRTHPSYATALENLGDIYAKMASQAYDKALQFDKTATTAQTKLALIKELFSVTQPAAQPLSGVPAPAMIAAAPATPAPVPAKPAAADPTGEVAKTVTNWANAWSRNDVNGYLAFYAPTFQIPPGQSRQAWETERKLRVAKPRKIEVRVGGLQVRFSDTNRVIVTFRQDYRSAGLQSSVTKTLVMSKDGGRWLIQQERVGS